jgi:hypothetical protein
MSNRDNFSKPTKDIIARRAGGLCCFPNCGNITVSASEESDTSTSSTGMACHISAASEGKNAKRYDSGLTPEQRMHSNNGIWMCYKHGKIIDTDEERFTTSSLQYWKELGESISRLMHENGIDYSTAIKNIPKRLANNLLNIDSLENENQLIGETLFDSCIHLTWGDKLANSIRDFIIEHTRNSIIHGNGDNVEIKIEFNKITITDNGTEFHPKEFEYLDGNGGKMAYTHLYESYNSDILITTQRTGNKNQTIISKLKEPEDIFDITDCSINMTLSEFKWGIKEYNIHETCQELFVVLPKYFTLSDFPRNGTHNELENEKRPITFIGENLSEMVIAMIKSKYPESNLIITL